MKCRVLNRSALTVLEVLVAVSIVGLILAIALPAAQRAREAGRQTECANNLRQIALACVNHSEVHRHFPTGGWGWQWMGDPDRGFGPKQPGGWVYNVLPYVEQVALRSRGKGRSPSEKRAEGREVAETALPVFNCPSRRAAQPYAFTHLANFNNIDRPRFTGRTDYCANVGDLAPDRYGPGPASLAEGDAPSYRWDQTDRTGLVFRRSTISPAHVRDGASQTYLVAEGYLDRERYTIGDATNDDQGMYVGYDRDTLRVAHRTWAPLRDASGVASDHSFGSAHAEAFHASFCDGAVRKVRYSISTVIHERLGNRKDGNPVDLAGL